MSNDVTELRQTLFDTLRDLKAGTMDIDRAKAINETAQTIINSAKVEADHLKITGGKGSGFIPEAPALPPPAATPRGTTIIDQRPGVRVTKHTLEG